MDMVLLIVGAALVLGGFIKGFSGFGTSIVLTGILLFLYEPSMIVPVLSVLSLFFNMMLFFEHAKYMKNWKSNFAFRPETLISLLLGAIIGAQMLLYLNVYVIKAIFGVMVIIFLYLIKHRIKTHLNFVIPRWESNATIGFSSGFFSGLINVNGPPPMIYGLYHKYDKVKLMKSVVIFYMIADLITVGVFYFTGLFTIDTIRYVLYFIPIALVGFFLGRQVRLVTTDYKFKRYVTLFLLVIAVKMIFESISIF